MNIMSISFDGFNSSSLNQNLYSRGLNTKIVSFSREKQLSYYNLLKQLIQRKDVLFPRDSPWTALIKTDLPSLVIKDNGQIVHPYGTKDLPDALAVSIFEAYTYGSNCNLINKIELKAPRLVNINTPILSTVILRNDFCLNKSHNKNGNVHGKNATNPFVKKKLFCASFML